MSCLALLRAWLDALGTCSHSHRSVDPIGRVRKKEERQRKRMYSVLLACSLLVPPPLLLLLLLLLADGDTKVD